MSIEIAFCNIYINIFAIISIRLRTKTNREENYIGVFFLLLLFLFFSKLQILARPGRIVKPDGKSFGTVPS